VGAAVPSTRSRAVRLAEEWLVAGFWRARRTTLNAFTVSVRESSSTANASQNTAAQWLRRCSRRPIRVNILVLFSLQAWLAALDDFRNWLIREAA
jgi:hypothetical protein